MHPDPLAHILGQGADVIVRTGWKGPRRLGKEGKSFDLLAALTVAEGAGLLDTPIWIGPKKAPPLALRIVAFRNPKEAAEAARAKARAAAKREGYAISTGTLTAAEWVILVTSLDAKAFAAADIGELDRARWRIELAFKRLKSLIGLSAPPSEDPETAKTWILAHFLMALLLEPHTSAPRSLPAWPRNCAAGLATDIPRSQSPACGFHASADAQSKRRSSQTLPARTAPKTILSSHPGVTTRKCSLRTLSSASGPDRTLAWNENAIQP